METSFNESIGNLTEKLSGWLDAMIVNMPNIIVACIVFTLAYYLSSQTNSLISKMLRKRIRQESIRSLISNILSIVIVALGLFLALGILNLDKALSSILAGAGVAGLAVGLALQGVLSNTFSGIFLAIKDEMNVGDFVETNGYSGTVDSIDLRFIKLRESDNNLVIIPNKMVVENPFKNFGLTSQIRTLIECGVGYESDLEHVETVTKQTIVDIFPQGDKKLEFHYLEFGDSSINFQIRFWVSAKENLTLLESKSLAIKALKKRFDQEGISIPYPIRTLQAEKKSIESLTSHETQTE